MMAKLFRITRTGWIVFLVCLVAAFILVTSARAQEASSSEQLAQQYGVTFPIKELGNCADITECRNFCEDPLNSATCIDYAKSKGFYKEEEVDVKKKEGILDKAKKELGCDSYETCKTFCQVPTNFEKCDAFAKKQGIAGGQVEDPNKKEIINKAKEILGCDSYSSCASFCSDDSNRQKCSDFAKETGLRGGERPVGPGGCTSAQSCQSFCSDPQNFTVCKGFVSSSGGQFQGPGGCSSEDSCKSYCSQNPEDCVVKPVGAAIPVPGKFDPQEMCNRTPNCSWNNNTCQCQAFNSGDTQKKVDEFAKFCKENPQRCTPGGIGGFESQQDRTAFANYCKDNPEKCRPAYSQYTGSYFDPALECSKYQSCSWKNGTCNCSSNTSAGSLSTEDMQKSCAAGGCRWIGTGNGCDCSQASADSPSMACTRQAGCSWINSTCQCSSYSGGTGGSYGSYGGTTTNTTSGGYGSKEDQERMCKTGGGSCDWSYGYCYCRNYQSSGSYTSGSGSTTTSGSYSGYTGSTTMTRDQQEAACKSGGGTCSWNGDICNCQGYHSTTTTSGTSGTSGSTTTTSGTSGTTTTSSGTSGSTSTSTSTGMSRDQQQAACTSCGGTCSWNGDTCQCQCASSGSTSASTQSTAPAPQPEQSTAPASSAPAPAESTAPAPSPTVQGVAIVRSIIDRILDLFR